MQHDSHTGHIHDYRPSGIIPHNQRPVQVMICGCGDVHSAFIPLPFVEGEDEQQTPAPHAPPRILVPQTMPVPLTHGRR